MGAAEVGGREAGRLDRWRAGWRVSLRMARRDVRRHRGRSLLVIIMVGLPVLLLTAGSTLWFSENLDTSERLPLQLASSPGYLVDPTPQVLQQLTDPRSSWSRDGQEPPPAKPVPGYAPGREQAALERLVGARLREVTQSMGTARVAGHGSQVGVLGIDPRGAGDWFSPRATLQAGRWPTGPDEVVVTGLGIAAGLPSSGTMELRVSTGGEESATWRTVTIVGVGTGYASWGVDEVHPVEVVTLPAAGSGDRQWLVDRPAAIGWPEIQKLNEYGVGAYSRYVAEHPESVTTGFTSGTGDNELATLYVVAAASLGLLLLTSLLAGPAFAVGAARQRHTLALAASNGATRAQLRRTVLAQAFVLGVVSALSGAVLGVAGAVVATAVVHRFAPAHFFGPAQVSWRAVAIVTVAGIVSSVVAALIPSRGLGRIDIVSVLRGQSISPPLRRRVPVVGAVMAAVGVAAVSFASFRSDDRYFFVFLGGVLLIVVGALLIVPLVLALGARVAHRLPLPARMAARESGRLRGRATPTVAAIMGSAAVLVTVCVGLQADTERGARTYHPDIAVGQAIVYAGTTPADAEETTRAITSGDPSLHVLQPRRVAPPARVGDAVVRLAAVRPGCSFAETAPELLAAQTPTSTQEPTLPRCATVATETSWPGSPALVVDVDELADFAGLDATQRSALAAGAVGMLDPAEAAALPPSQATAFTGLALDQLRPLDLAVSDGKSRWFRYSVTYDANATPTIVTRHPEVVTLPVVTLSHAQWLRTVVAGYGGPGVFLPRPVADRLGIVTGPDQALVRADGPITQEQEARLRDAVQARFAEGIVRVERGYERDDTMIITLVIALIALIILVATLIATALGQAEAAPLLGTLAAVGATKRTRRALAASQAVYLALVGAVLGLLVGLAPGVAISRILTATYTDSGMDYSTVIIDVPWLQVLVPVVLVPVVAGALAWVSIRTAPVVVRRTT
ncbi:FtsX-like permease family protein [Intrasporangium flavum]|uniref:FtsX-like permease family protein n=1 Tax=Intrasporangium flavum TaxID=1428657 RepID=UPI001A96546F|nr:FtsX-like permease family protein [Intrasporangium flavum]